jgi:lipid-A-disaccharide synthase
MKYYIIAGERSGDLHGSNLIKAILQKDANAQIRAWGGDMMQEAGATLVKHYKDCLYGLCRSHQKSPYNSWTFIVLQKDIQAYQPDVVILSTMRDSICVWRSLSNLLVSKHSIIFRQKFGLGINHVHSISRNLLTVCCVIFLSKRLFKKYDYEVDYVGNPLFDAIADFQKPNLKEARVGQKPIAFTRLASPRGSQNSPYDGGTGV